MAIGDLHCLGFTVGPRTSTVPPVATTEPWNDWASREIRALRKDVEALMSSKSDHFKAKPHGGKTRLLREFYAFVAAQPPSEDAAALLSKAKAYDPNIAQGIEARQGGDAPTVRTDLTGHRSAGRLYPQDESPVTK